MRRWALRLIALLLLFLLLVPFYEVAKTLYQGGSFGFVDEP